MCAWFYCWFTTYHSLFFESSISLYLSLALRPELVRAATTLYQHNLTGILETAVRATNAQFDTPEILKRLDVRLLEVLRRDWVQKTKMKRRLMVNFSTLLCITECGSVVQVSPGDTGWDVFSLDYHVEGPISTVNKLFWHKLKINFVYPSSVL